MATQVVNDRSSTDPAGNASRFATIFATFVDTSPDGMGVLDSGGVVLYANQALERLMRVPTGGLLGTRLIDHVHGGARKVLAESDVSAGAEGLELRLENDAGAGLHVAAWIRPVPDIDGSELVCVTIQDLTQRRRESAASRRAEAATDLNQVARDLHDVVIQRLFSIGIRLGGIAKRVDGADGPRLTEIAEEIDETVEKIRRTIFALAADLPSNKLSDQLARVAQDSTGTFGFTPSLRLVDGVDAAVPPRLWDDIAAALRDALAEIASRVSATEITVDAGIDSGELVLRVVDDARDAGSTDGASELLRASAEELGGMATFGPNADDRGHVLDWRIPIPD